MQQQPLEQPSRYSYSIAVVMITMVINDIGWDSVGEHNRNEIV